MAKKKQVPLHPAHWVVSEEIKVNGRTVVKGTELSIKGEPGRFLFLKHVKTPTVEWLDVIGGTKGHKMLRSFYIESVKTVHWKNKTRENLSKEKD